MIVLGLDIGSNSVGSAWVDAQEEEFKLGVGRFPAGVEESEKQRGTPKNQARREKRSQRRNISRRSKRKIQLRSILTRAGLLPTDEKQLRELFNGEPVPWILRREALERPLTAYEFGRFWFT